MNRIDIIGIAGLAGAGKDTVALLLKAHLRFEHLAFGDPLRAEICHAFDLPVARLTDRATKAVPGRDLAIERSNKDEFIGVMVKHAREAGHDIADFLQAPRSPREIMRWWGTDYRRNTTHTDYWTRNLTHRVHTSQGTKLWGHGNNQWRHVISDVRFQNEADTVRRMGGQIWQVVRPDVAHDTSHVSETEGFEFAPNVVIDNSGDLAHLRGLVLGAWLMREASLSASEVGQMAMTMMPAATREYEQGTQRGPAAQATTYPLIGATS